MARIIDGQLQNTIYLNAYEQTILQFKTPVSLEFLNLSEGYIWMKWHGDCTPEISGLTSTPLPPGAAYDRSRFPGFSPFKLGLISDKNATLVVNVI